MKPKRFAASAAFAALLAAPPLHGEAWPRGTGNLFAHFGATSFSSDTMFDTRGRRIPFPGRGYEEKGDTLYLELGLTDSLTFVSTLPLKKVTARGFQNDFTNRGLADLDVRLRYSRRVGKLFLGLDGGAFVPLGYRQDEFPQLGTGKVDALLNASVGGSLPFLPEGFASFDLGYRFRGGPLSDELPFAAKLGAFPHRRVGIFGFARGHLSRADFDSVDPFFGLENADSSRLLAGVELYVRASRHFDVNGSFSRVVAGRNTPIGNQFLLGVAFHTKLF